MFCHELHEFTRTFSAKLIICENWCNLWQKFSVHYYFKQLNIMNDNLNPTRLPLKVIWIYAMGQLGWSLASYGISSLLPYFYMPPETSGQSSIFPTFIPQTAIFGITLLGLISGGGRLFDAFNHLAYSNDCIRCNMLKLKGLTLRKYIIHFLYIIFHHRETPYILMKIYPLPADEGSYRQICIKIKPNL